MHFHPGSTITSLVHMGEEDRVGASPLHFETLDGTNFTCFRIDDWNHPTPHQDQSDDNYSSSEDGKSDKNDKNYKPSGKPSGIDATLTAPTRRMTRAVSRAATQRVLVTRNKTYQFPLHGGEKSLALGKKNKGKPTKVTKKKTEKKSVMRLSVDPSY
jgi:hypothetical protein